MINQVLNGDDTEGKVGERENKMEMGWETVEDHIVCSSLLCHVMNKRVPERFGMSRPIEHVVVYR